MHNFLSYRLVGQMDKGMDKTIEKMSFVQRKLTALLRTEGRIE